MNYTNQKTWGTRWLWSDTHAGLWFMDDFGNIVSVGYDTTTDTAAHADSCQDFGE